MALRIDNTLTVTSSICALLTLHRAVSHTKRSISKQQTSLEFFQYHFPHHPTSWETFSLLCQAESMPYPGILIRQPPLYVVAHWAHGLWNCFINAGWMLLELKYVKDSNVVLYFHNYWHKWKSWFYSFSILFFSHLS